MANGKQQTQIIVHNRQIKHIFLWLFTLFVLGSWNASAQTAARPERGTRPAGTYSASDIDNISLTSGNVNVSIPLASLPPMAGGKLSWTVSAQYNSKLWDVTRTEHQIPLGPTYVVDNLQLSDAGGWKIGAAYSLTYQDSRASYDWIQPTNPSDPDYALLQYQWGKMMLMTPDGAEHELRPVDYQPFSGSREYLKGYYKDTPDTTGSAMRYYSFDGSFLWAIIYPTGNAVRWEVYLPDGTHIVQRTNGIQRIWDNNGNQIIISSTIDGSGVVTTSYRDGMAQGTYAREIQYIQNGTSRQVRYRKVDANLSSATNWVTIDIALGSTTIQGKTYPVQDVNASNQICTRTEGFSGMSAEVISNITLPQTDPGQAGRQFVFSYNSDTTETTNLPYQATCGGAYFTLTTSSIGMGSLSQITMPSGAVIQYTYYQDSLSGNFKHQLLSADEASREPLTRKRVIHDGVIDDWNYNITTISGSVSAPDGSTTTQRFYLHDRGMPGYYGGINGVGGLVYKTTQSDKVITERRWTSLLFSGGSQIGPGGNLVTFNPVVDVEYTTLLAPDGVTLAKMSAKKYQYDYNGNLIQEIDYDWFDPALVSRDSDGVPTGVPASATVLRVVNNSYYHPALTSASANVYAKRLLASVTPLILNAPQESSLSSASTLLSKSQLSYDNQAYGNAPTLGNLTREARQLIQESRWIEVTHAYDSYGNRTSTTAPSGAGNNTITMVYDFLTHAQPTSVTVNPQNGTGAQTSSTAYDYWTGLPVSQTDVNSQTTTIDYTNQRLFAIDPYGRPGVVTSPAVTSFVDGVSYANQAHKVVSKYYDNAQSNNAGQVEVFSDLKQSGDGLLKSRTTVDQLGRTVLSESSEDGASYTISSQMVYEQLGRISYANNPQRASAASTDGWARTTRDNIGRVTEVATFAGRTQPPSSGTNGNWTGSVTTGYDANATTVTDQAGKVRRSLLDGLSRLVRVDEPNAAGSLGTVAAPTQPTSYGYDALGNLTGVTQGSQTRSFTYDSLSRLKTALNPEQVGAMSYTYDDASNLTRRDHPNASFLSFTYDGVNRATTKTYSTGGVWTYSYDTGVAYPKGRLVSVVKQGSTDGTYYDGYDAAGRLSASRQITTAGGQANSYSMSYAYDLAGNLTKEVYPSGKEYRTTYDNAARVSAASRYLSGSFDKTYASAISYMAHGAMSAISFGGTPASPVTREMASYNSRLQPTQIELRKLSDNSVILGLDYGYGTQSQNNGNLASQTIRIGTSTTISQSYSYDSLNRLSTASESGAWTQIYDYDRFGNRAVRNTSYLPTPQLTPQSAFAGDLSAVNQATNRLAVSGYSYDNAGNLKSDPTTSANAYQYDSENKQTAYTKAGVTTNYSYDADGRRVLKSDSSGTLLMVYDVMGKLIAEYRSDPVPPPQAGGGVSYVMADALGSTRVVTDAGGAVKSRRDYLPFGEEIPTSAPGVRGGIAGYGASDGQRNRFTSKERDDESGLDYFLARYYSAAQGRFTSPDEFTGGPDELYNFADDAAENPTFYADIAEPQSLNKYQYCFNNPLNTIDPDGHQELKNKLKQAANALINTTRGAISAWAEDNGAAPIPGEQTSVGRAIGHIGAVVQAGVEIYTGVSGMIGGTGEAIVTSPAAGTGVGAVVPAAGVGMAVGGAILAGHGISVLYNTYKNVTKTYETYTKENPQTGEVYSGMTSGTGTPQENVAKRERNHHRNKDGFGPAKLDKSSKNRAAIRGREQQLIDYYRKRRKAADQINGISPRNKKRAKYLREAEKAFGKLK